METTITLTSKQVKDLATALHYQVDNDAEVQLKISENTLIAKALDGDDWAVKYFTNIKQTSNEIHNAGTGNNN